MTIKKNKYTHVIWDWNGTLLDDVGLCIETVNTMLARRRLPILCNIEAYHRVFGFPVIDYYRRLGFDFAKEPFEVVAEEFMNIYHSDTERFHLFNRAVEVLTAVREAGLHQIILSASEQNNLRSQVGLFDVNCYFDEILGISNIYATSKVNIGKDYIMRVNIGRSILIGDTIHDFDVAKALGVDCILVADGHQSKPSLLTCGVPVVDNICDVLDFLNRGKSV